MFSAFSLFFGRSLTKLASLPQLSIARAVYADADVYIFDDPLSALDAHVAKTIFDDCICGLLKVLIRKSWNYLSRAVLLKRLKVIVEGGTFFVFFSY